MDTQEGKKKETLIWSGDLVWFYPATGVVYNPVTSKFVANLGGSSYFKPKEMADKRWTDVRASIIEGLALASEEIGLAGIPQSILAEIVKKRALLAASDAKRDGTEAAKFVFSLVQGDAESHGRDRSTVQIRFNDEMAKYAIDRLIDSKKEE